jgi:hypothetical protein
MTIQEKAKALIPLLQAIVEEKVVEVNNVVEYGKYNWEDMERVVNDTLSTTLRSIIPKHTESNQNQRSFGQRLIVMVLYITSIL